MHPPVDENIYVEMAKAMGRNWTFSYLSKAGHRGDRLWPYTVTAWERIRQESRAMEILNRHGVRLMKPEPYHDGRNFMGSTERSYREAA